MTTIYVDTPEHQQEMADFYASTLQANQFLDEEDKSFVIKLETSGGFELEIGEGFPTPIILRFRNSSSVDSVAESLIDNGGEDTTPDKNHGNHYVRTCTDKFGVDWYLSSFRK